MAMCGILRLFLHTFTNSLLCRISLSTTCSRPVSLCKQRSLEQCSAEAPDLFLRRWMLSRVPERRLIWHDFHFSKIEGCGCCVENKKDESGKIIWNEQGERWGWLQGRCYPLKRHNQNQECRQILGESPVTQQWSVTAEQPDPHGHWEDESSQLHNSRDVYPPPYFQTPALFQLRANIILLHIKEVLKSLGWIKHFSENCLLLEQFKGQSAWWGLRI